LTHLLTVCSSRRPTGREVAIPSDRLRPWGEVYAEWAQGLNHFAGCVPARVIEPGRETRTAPISRDRWNGWFRLLSGGNPAYLAAPGGSRAWASIEAAVWHGAAYVGCSAGRAWLASTRPTA
jgi:hypothetical protein